MNAFKVKPNTTFFNQLDDIFTVHERWEDATPEIGTMIGVEGLERVGLTGKKLYLPQEEAQKIENWTKLFKAEKGLYTPRLNTKLGKAWTEGFKEIVERHRLDIDEFGVLMFKYGMYNTRYEKPYHNSKLFKLDGNLYVSWEGAGLAKDSSLEPISSREYYDVLLRLEEMEKEHQERLRKEEQNA